MGYGVVVVTCFFPRRSKRFSIESIYLHFVVLLQHLVALFCCKTGNFSVNVSKHWEVFLVTKLCSKDLIWFSQNFFVPYHQFAFVFFFCFDNVLFGKVFLVDLCIIKKL